MDNAEPIYLHLPAGHHPPPLPLKPFRAVVVVEDDVDNDWRNQISDWLVASGCLYMCAWGRDCALWDDSVDWACLSAFNFGEIPHEKHVYTTWHHNEPLGEAFWYMHYCAVHPTVEIAEVRIIDVAPKARAQELLALYQMACAG